MSKNAIILKNNQFPGKIPSIDELILGEIAINTADAKLYTKKNDGSVVTIGSSDSLVQSVAGRTGQVILTKSDVGLSNVDNTSDLDKPISSAQIAVNSNFQTSLSNKVDINDSRLFDARVPLYHTHSILGLNNDVVGATAVGVNALEYLQNNSVESIYINNYSTAFGTEALSDSKGVNNTAVGYNTLKLNTTGDNNTAIGSFSSELTVVGVRNVMVGGYSGKNMTTAGGNVGIGFSAVEVLTTGFGNIGIGSFCLGNVTVGVDNVAIGRFTSVTNGFDSGCIILGSFAQAQSSGELVIGSEIRPINTSTTVGATGPTSIQSLPTRPLGYLFIRLNNNLVRIPYYN
jgi:hypothetical protein